MVILLRESTVIALRESMVIALRESMAIVLRYCGDSTMGSAEKQSPSRGDDMYNSHKGENVIMVMIAVMVTKAVIVVVIVVVMTIKAIE